MNNKKRPFLYKIIIFSLLIIAMMGWLRAYQSIYQWEWLIKYDVFPGPWYTLITGVLIGVIATLGVVVGWLRLVWSAKYIQVIVVLISLGWWLDYLLFSQSSIALYNLPFRIVMNFLYLIFVAGYFYLTKVETLKGMKDEKR